MCHTTEPRYAHGGLFTPFLTGSFDRPPSGFLYRSLFPYTCIWKTCKPCVCQQRLRVKTDLFFHIYMSLLTLHAPPHRAHVHSNETSLPVSTYTSLFSHGIPANSGWVSIIPETRLYGFHYKLIYLVYKSRRTRRHRNRFHS